MDWETTLSNHEYDCIGAVVLDDVGAIRAVSDGVLEFSGHDRPTLLTMAATDLVHPDDLARGLDVLAEVFVTPGTRADGMYRLRQADGSYESFALRAINLGSDADDAIVIRFSRLDNRTRVSAEAFSEDVVDATRMLCQETSLREFFDWAMRVGERHVAGLDVIVTVLAGDGPNRVYNRTDIPDGLAATNAAATAAELPPHVQAALDEHRRGPWLAPNRVATRDVERPERLTSILDDHRGDIAGYIEFLRPTTSTPQESEWLLLAMITQILTAAMQRFDLDQQLRWAADHDPLTGLVNRRKLVEAIDARTGDRSYLCLIDLDRFSWINNTFGHQAGDDVLVAVSTALAETFGADAVIARMGGDEFVVWVAQLPADQDLATQGERLRQAMQFELGPPERRSRIRASIGIAEMPLGETAASAISRADGAMYAAKRGGGDSVAIAD